MFINISTPSTVPGTWQIINKSLINKYLNWLNKYIGNKSTEKVLSERSFVDLHLGCSVLFSVTWIELYEMY